MPSSKTPKTPKPAPKPKRIISLAVELDSGNIERTILKIAKSTLEDTWELEKLIGKTKLNSAIMDIVMKAMSSDTVQTKISEMVESRMDSIINKVISRQIDRIASTIDVPDEEMARIVREALAPKSAKPKKEEVASRQPEDEA